MKSETRGLEKMNECEVDLRGGGIGGISGLIVDNAACVSSIFFL